MDQTPATTDTATAADPPAESTPVAAPELLAEAPIEEPGFRGRGRLRRRVRFLRKARELAYRDLGGLVFNLHRYGQRNDVLVIAKLTTLTHIDTELRALEAALDERNPVTILREAGVSACPRCAAIHSGDDRFCPNCGLSMSRRVELPVAGPPAPEQGGSPASAASPGMAEPSATSPPVTPPQATTPPAITPPAASPPRTPAPATPPGSQPPPGTSPRATPPPAAARPATPPPATPPPATPPQAAPPPASPARATEQPTQIIRPPAPDA